jgi:hypothetical protein
MRRVDVAVQRQDMPRTQIVTVKSPPRGTGIGAEIFEIGLGLPRLVIVVAGRRPGSLLVPAPTRAVTIAETLRRSFGIGIVAGGKNRAANFVQQLRRRLALIVALATGDVAGADQNFTGGLNLIGAQENQQRQR